MYVRTLAGEKSKHRKASNLPQAMTSLIPPMLLQPQYTYRTVSTLPTAEILSGKNARAFLVCGFLMKSFKKNIVGAIWKLPAK